MLSRINPIHGRSKSSVEFRVPVRCFWTRMFLQCEVVSLTLNPQAVDHSWSIIHYCLFNIIAANLHIWRPTPPSATQGTRHTMVTGTHGRYNTIKISSYNIRNHNVSFIITTKCNIVSKQALQVQFTKFISTTIVKT